MNVLFATDGSSYALETARSLMHLQSTKAIKLTVLTVSYTPENTSSAGVQPWLPQWREQENARVGAHHEQLSEMLSGIAAEVEMLQVEGAVIREILDHTKKLKTDLLVIGARGHSTIARILLGSTSDTLATHAECSVLVIRTPDASHKPQPESPKAIHQALLAYDGSASSNEAVNDVLMLRWPDSFEINVLSVIPTFECYGQDYGLAISQHEQDERQRVQLLGEEIITRLTPRVSHVSAQIATGDHVGDTIVRTAEQNGSELIILGDNGHGMIGEWLLGSTTKYVLRHAHCSVWISRHHRQSA